MAGKIRGITIELSADASGVLDAVKGVNSQLKSTSNQLKDVERLLKLDPSNTQLLTQKTELLQKQIENCKEKLDVLKQAQADMDANGVDKNSEQYQALQREIIATEQELKGLERTTGSASAALAKVSVVTGELGEKMESAGKKMAVVSAGLVALGTASVKAFKEVDEGADTVIKKTGATGEAADEMERVYKNLAGSLMGDFTEIGSAVGEVATRFQLTGQDLEDTAGIFQKFAYINDVDVSNAIDNVQKAMSAFGLSTSDTETLLNVMNKAGQDTGVSMDSLASNLVINATALQEMGLDAYQASVFMAQLETSGADSSAVLTGLKKALYNASQEGKTLDEALEDLEKQVLSSESSTDALNYVYDLFGSKAAPAVYQALKNGTLSFTDLADSIGITEAAMGSINNTYDQTLDGTDQMTLAWKNLKLGLAELGEAISNTLAPVLEKVVSIVQSVTEWFSNLDEGTKETIITIGLMIAAISPLLIIGGKVLKGISSVTKAISSIGTASAGPIGLAIVAVAALTTASLALIDSWKDSYAASSPYTEALNKLKEANDELAGSIQSTRDNYDSAVSSSEANGVAAQALYGKLLNLISAYSGTAEEQQLINGIVAEMNELVPGLGLAWDEVTNSLNLTNAEITSNIELMKQQAQMAAAQQMYIEAIENQARAEQAHSLALETLKAQMADYGITMQELTSALDDGYISGTEWLNMTRFGILEAGEAYGAWSQFNEVLSEYGESCDNSAKATQDVAFAEELLGEKVTQVQQQTAIAADTIQEKYQEVFGTAIPADLDEAITAAQNAGVEIPQSLVDGLLNGSISVESAIQQIIDLTDQSTQAAENGAATGEAYVEATASIVVDERTTVGAAASVATEELDTSEDAYSIGSDVGSNYDSGLASQETSVSTTAAQMASDVIGEFDTTPSEMNAAGSDAGSNMQQGINSQLTSVQNVLQKMAGYFQSEMQDIGNVLYRLGDAALKRLASVITSITSGEVVPAIQSCARAFQNGFSSLRSDMYNVGNNAGAGLYNGFSSWQGTLSSMAWSIANSINAAARAALRIKSPSKEMEEVGEFTGEGLEIGLENKQKGILKKAQQLAGSISGAFEEPDIHTGMAALNRQTSGNHGTAIHTAINSSSVLNSVLSMLFEYLPYLAAGTQIQFDDGSWAGRLAPAMNREFETMKERSARG